MSEPMAGESRGMKRSACEQYNQPPHKRANIPGDLTPDRGYDRNHEDSTSGRKLVPEVSRAEAAQFQGYLMDTSYTGDAGQGDDESEDEFVDAQEGVVATPFGKVMVGQAGEEGNDTVDAAAGTSDSVKMDVSEVNDQIDEEDSGEARPKHYEPSAPKMESQSANKIKPETISIASDSEDEANDAEDNDPNKTYEIDAEFQKILDGEDSAPEQDVPFDDLFAETFVGAKTEATSKVKESIEIEEEGADASNNSITFTTSNPSKLFTSGIHTTKIHSNNSENSNNHTTTPPPPQTMSSRPPPAPRRRPDLKCDLSTDLLRHSKFHTRAQLLIPRLPNHENFDWTRRYWIAVLIQGKRPTKSNISEKDFVWMKGNRFSTVATVFHSYALAVMADPEDLALVLGEERVEMTDQMLGLDWFNDRLVVFRAVKVEGNEREVEGRGLSKGIVPESAVISLDLD